MFYPICSRIYEKTFIVNISRINIFRMDLLPSLSWDCVEWFSESNASKATYGRFKILSVTGSSAIVPKPGQLLRKGFEFWVGIRAST